MKPRERHCESTQNRMTMGLALSFAVWEVSIIRGL